MWFDEHPIALSIDCETLSLDPRAHILQVGFCVINLLTGDVLQQPANAWIDPDPQGDRVIDASTVRWWLGQRIEVRERVWAPPAGNDYTSPQELFDELSSVMAEHEGRVRVWTRGNKDLTWLETLWGGKTPWHYRLATDMRPIVSVFDPVGTFAPEDTDSKHDGAADAMHQAKHLAAVVKYLRCVERDADLYRTRVNP